MGVVTQFLVLGLGCGRHAPSVSVNPHLFWKNGNGTLFEVVLRCCFPKISTKQTRSKTQHFDQAVDDTHHHSRWLGAGHHQGHCSVEITSPENPRFWPTNPKKSLIFGRKPPKSNIFVPQILEILDFCSRSGRFGRNLVFFIL